MENLQSLNPNRSQRALTVLKFFIAILCLPWIYSFTIAFINQAKLIKGRALDSFIWGILSFVITYHFLYTPSAIYKKEQKITEATFRFISPLVKFAPIVLPIYSIGLFLFYYLISLVFTSGYILILFMFLIGFSFIFHLVFTAKILRSRKDDFLMINYLFTFGFIYIINVAILALIFSILFEPFSWFSFLKATFEISRNVFISIFTQLFL